MTTPHPLPAPVPGAAPEDVVYWRAAAAGRLLVPFCRGCRRFFWYPRPSCPLCGADDVEPVEGSGRGTIYSWTRVRRGLPPYDASAPYLVAYVELDEGPCLLTNLVEVPDGHDPECGAEVELAVVRAADDVGLVRFRLASAR